MRCRRRRTASSIIRFWRGSGASMPPPELKSFARDLATSHFAIAGADLLIGGTPVRELAAHYGTPLFIYDGGVMRRSYRRLAEALSGFARIHYSVKANPTA